MPNDILMDVISQPTYFPLPGFELHNASDEHKMNSVSFGSEYALQTRC